MRLLQQGATGGIDMMRFVVGFILGAMAAGGLGACGKAADDLTHSRRAPSQSATVARVVDGDTIHVSVNGEDRTVRLIGIDTPETHKPGVKIECGGKQASDNLKRLAPVGAKVRLVKDSTQDAVDRYGRMLAYVYVDHKQLQLEQLYAGLAEVYVYGGHPFRRADSYRRAEGVARRAHRGVWDFCSADFHSNQPGGER